MLKQRLEQLRRLSMGKDADVMKAMVYFLEGVAECARFKEHQKIFSNANPFYSLIIPVARYYGAHVNVTSMMLFKVNAHHFMYGAAEFSNQLFALLYFFEDAQMGTVAVFSNTSAKQFFHWVENKLCVSGANLLPKLTDHR